MRNVKSARDLSSEDKTHETVLMGATLPARLHKEHEHASVDRWGLHLPWKFTDKDWRDGSLKVLEALETTYYEAIKGL
jgi:hypothetical protein